MKTILIALTVCVLVGCNRHEPVTTQSTGNGGFTVDVIGKDADGYTIKRFNDGGKDIYYITPGPASVFDEHQQGKTTVRNQSQTTQ